MIVPSHDNLAGDRLTKIVNKKTLTMTALPGIILL